MKQLMPVSVPNLSVCPIVDVKKLSRRTLGQSHMFYMSMREVLIYESGVLSFRSYSKFPNVCEDW